MRESSLLAQVRDSLARPGMPGPGAALVVGLSGGADSVALLDALVRLAPQRRLRLVAAHLDHALRPDSAEDAAFCAALCRELGVELRTSRIGVRRTGGGVEEAARERRYAFLREVRAAVGAEAIAVAHTRDDQAETLLLRLLRGSGSDGLAAMAPRRGELIRPLLGVSRAEVREHLERAGLSWREDPTNAELGFARNRVRHELIPYLEQRFNPRLRESLARTAELLADEAELLEAGSDALYRRAARRDGAGVTLDLAPLRGAPRALARRTLRRALGEAGGLRGIARVHVDRILELAERPRRSGRRLPLPGRRLACFRFDEVWLGPERRDRRFAVGLPVPGRVELPDGRALLARPWRGGAAPGTIPWPNGVLTVRTRRPGDRVRRGGREVSLKRFLLERRVPADLRGALPLVASGRRVLWVAGQELERPPADGGRLLRLELQPPRAELTAGGS